MPQDCWVLKEKYQGPKLLTNYEASWNKPEIESYLQATDPKNTKLRKYATKYGIPDERKAAVYVSLLGVDKLEDYEKNYEAALIRTHGKQVPETPIPPYFGGRPNRHVLALSPEGWLLVDHILCIIGHDFPSIEYCPFLPPLVVLLVHHLRTADEVLGAVVSILKSNMNEASPSPGKWAYFPMSHKSLKLMIRIFPFIVQKNSLKLGQHVTKMNEVLLKKSLNKEHGVASLWERWMSNLFVDVLPQPVLWRFLDMFLLDGFSAIYKMAMELMSCQKPALLKTTSPMQWREIFQLEALKKVPIDTLLESAWAWPISWSDIEKVQATLVEQTPSEEQDEDASKYKYERAHPKLKTASNIMQELHWIALWSWIPPRHRLSEVELIFSTSEHGYNLGTLYEMSGDGRKPLILVMETTESRIFGAFISAGWPKDIGMDVGLFEGDGETFLFTLEPYAKSYQWVGLESFLKEQQTATPITPVSDSEQADNKYMYPDGMMDPWAEKGPTKSQKNDTRLFVNASRKLLIIGGGKGFGLTLNDSLSQGTTEPCLTFANEPLTGDKTRMFECVSVEVFAFN